MKKLFALLVVAAVVSVCGMIGQISTVEAKQQIRPINMTKQEIIKSKQKENKKETCKKPGAK